MFISVTFLDRVTCLPHNVTKVDVIPGELGSPRFQSPCRGLGLLPEKQLAMLSVFVSSRLGRKGGGLLLNNGVMAVGAALMGLEKYAGSYQMLIAGRVVIGINSGLNAGLAPMKHNNSENRTYSSI